MLSTTAMAKLAFKFKVCLQRSISVGRRLWVNGGMSAMIVASLQSSTTHAVIVTVRAVREASERTGVIRSVSCYCPLSITIKSSLHYQASCRSWLWRTVG